MNDGGYYLKALLLSIKPEYVEKILQGSKKYEYRKRLAKEDVSVIYIYCTAPFMKIVASVQVIDRLTASPYELWEKTKSSSGISKEKYKKYFHGCERAYAYKLGEVEIFKSQKNLSDFGLSKAPQSFVYIEI